MSLTRKRVAIIGGGFAGVAAVKMIREEGMEPICYEKSDNIGGTWFYREDDTEGLPSVMSTTIINHSKEFSSLSDFPVAKEFPNYLRHSELYNYFMNIVKHFDLARSVTCNREVILVKKASDYEETGRWSVSVKNTEDGSVTTETFDGVFVCVGHICYPKMAQYPGMDKFSGKIMHTHSLKRFEKFSNQHVTVIGTGCSALDASVEISTVAKQVYLSVRTPSWIMNRVGPSGLPIDYSICRRYILFFQSILPLKVVSWIIERYFLDSKFSHKLYGIEPKYPLLARDPIINDAIASKLLSGSVVLKRDVQYFTENGIVFDGEKQVTKMDTVIMATGYTWKFDFLEEGTIQMENGRLNLYKCMYPTQLKHPTLAIIGFVLPFGPGFPIGELQLRWASRLLASKCPFPSEEVRLQDARQRHEANAKRYSPSEKTSVRVDFVPYLDEIATELGVKPNFWKMAFTDPKLFVACIFGPCLPFQYRLYGPHKWNGARQAILSSSERMKTPLSPEKVHIKEKENSKLRIYILKNLLIPLMIICILGLKDSSIKYYFCALMMGYYLLFSTYFSKFFMAALVVPLFINFHGLMALFVLTIAASIYSNFGNILVNINFWT